MEVDYSLYLVTDSTEPILGRRELAEVVELALEGGVTIVQYRDKTSSTKELVATAKKLHELTQRHRVPLIINDRVDVAMAVGAEGVHIGQDDMDLASTRQMLGPEAIIGVTCNNISEAEFAASGGANYLGIGAVFATSTKADTKSIIGTAGTRVILDKLSASKDLHKVATVAIGGINASNVQRVLYQSRGSRKALNGVAVVSAIMGPNDTTQATTNLRYLLSKPPAFFVELKDEYKARDPQSLLTKIPQIARKVLDIGPLSHNMTNQVATNFAANVAIAIGARPIMSQDGDEAADLSSLGGCLILNMGTVQSQTLENYVQALKAYNTVGGPVVFDPVGAGATELRRCAVKHLMASGYFDIIKGNESEIKTVYGDLAVQQKGVDSARSSDTIIEKALLVKRLARRERNVVLMTGAIDVLSDGDRVYEVRNGHEYLSRITASGCVLGTCLGSYAACEKQDKLLATLAAMLVFEIAAEYAGMDTNVRGPGSFVPAFIDNLHRISKLCQANDASWLSAARVEIIHVPEDP